MSNVFDRRGAPNRPGGTSAVRDIAAPGRGTLTAGALPRTTRDLPPSEADAGFPAANATAAANGAPEALAPVRVTARGLNVRRTPDVAAGNVIGGLHSGAVVTPLAHTGDWLRIEYRGDAGFIHGGFVEPVDHHAAASGAAGDA